MDGAKTIWVLALLMACAVSASGQGISRTHGLGLRGSLWKSENQAAGFDIGGSPTSVTVDISGAGVSVYYFSRMAGNLFLETSLGSVGNLRVNAGATSPENVDLSAIIPFLFGFRFDVLSARYATAFQPYVAGGVGPYWIVFYSARSFAGLSNELSLRSDLKFGGYAGGGLNAVLRSWFALNFDVKYHFVDFKAGEGYSGLEFGIGFSLMWGRRKEIFRVREVKVIVPNIYPAYYQVYNTYPLALVTVENRAGYPIEVKVRSFVEHYSEHESESETVRIPGGRSKDIPVRAIFGKKLLAAARREPAMVDIEVIARAGNIEKKKSLNARVMVHSRNAWNGEIDKLSLFVTPDDERIIELSREMVKSAGLDGDDGREKFGAAQAIFNQLRRKGIAYVSDPNIPFYKDDRVQFADQTLDIGTGDCDDLVVLYASLLESIGIQTAFVDVRDPQKELAHVYLLFNSGVPVERSDLISSNDKRFVIRQSRSGQRRLWIPVELTLVEDGFDAAWQSGALQYIQEGILRNGLAEGWVKIIDVD